MNRSEAQYISRMNRLDWLPKILICNLTKFLGKIGQIAESFQSGLKNSKPCDCGTTKERSGHKSAHYHSLEKVGFFSEDYFLEMLTIERKRTERSGKPFLLMLIDISGFLEHHRYENAATKLVRVLQAFTREIDLKGWYRQEKEIGVIFTETSPDSKSMIMEKIGSEMNRNLSALQKSLIHVSFLSFPEGKKEEALPAAKEDPLTMYPKSTGQAGFSISLFAKRMIDVLCSLAAIAAFSPLFLILPILIKLTSKGPVIYRQPRMGLAGREFTFLKFRTMGLNTGTDYHRKHVQVLIHKQKQEGKNSKEIWKKLENDPRITPLGRFLRKTSLDEIPQFFNVLKGDMSIVGPRPPIPYEVEIYDIWHRQRIFDMKPGITGMWQVEGRNATSFDDMVRMDIRYIEHWSLWMDLKLIFLTPWAMASTRGAR